MHNHIRAKFLDLKFAPISQGFFLKHLDEVVELLRSDFPNHETKDIQSIGVHIRNDGSDSKHHAESSKELFMVDSDGVLGFRLSNSNLVLSTHGYLTFEILKESFKKIFDVLKDKLNITHFFTVSLRNINVFELDEDSDTFIHIRDNNQWGKQDFKDLEKKYVCSGAATRHQYFSNDYYEEFNLASFVVFPNHSFVPPETWVNWLLKGKPPVAEKEEILLSIDLSNVSFAAPANKAGYQNKSLKFDWSIISEKVNNLHSSINDVYANIIEKNPENSE